MSAIPKLIHQIWLGSEPPSEVVAYAQTWREHHPSWSYKLWHEGNLPRLEGHTQFNAARTMAMKADIVRYELLLEHGGLYVDADFECFRSIERFCDRPNLVVASEYGLITNSLIASAPGHPLMAELVQHCRQLSRVDLQRGPVHVVTGPHLLDRKFSEGGYIQARDTFVLASDYLFRSFNKSVERDGRGAAKRFALHHEHASWHASQRLTSLRHTVQLRTRIRRFLDLGHP